jgi:hypothetical protein
VPGLPNNSRLTWGNHIAINDRRFRLSLAGKRGGAEKGDAWILIPRRPLISTRIAPFPARAGYGGSNSAVDISTDIFRLTAGLDPRSRIDRPAAIVVARFEPIAAPCAHGQSPIPFPPCNARIAQLAAEGRHQEREAACWQLAELIMRGPVGFNPHRRAVERRAPGCVIR